MTPPKPVPTPPFCCNCTHFIEGSSQNAAEPGFYPKCRVAEMLDLVTGKKFFPLCQDLRHPQAPCGQDAKLFQPKNVQPLPEADKTKLN
jgi:hypothetical protein